jgi:glycosyltransferase involved in cell wall biosynthesis
VTGLRVAHLQPMTLDLFGHDERDFGTKLSYSVSNLAAAQARLGLRPSVHLLAKDAPHAFRAGDVPVRFHQSFEPFPNGPMERRFARQLSVSMLRALSRERFDVVHFHGVRQLQPMFAAVAWRAARAGLPLVGQERGIRPTGRIETAAMRYGLARCGAVLAASEDGAAVLRELSPRPQGVGLLPNGVDPQVFRPAAEPQRRNGSLRLLAVSRLAPEKDPATMADGVIRAAGEGHPITLTVVGHGVLRDDIERRLRDGGVDARFVGHVPQSELAELYRGADALLLTSLAEGWNQAVVEAMACGVPVVATDVTGTRDAAGDAGLLVPAREPEALAGAIGRLAGDRELWNDLRERGLERASSLTWDAIAERTAAVYVQILNGVAEPVAR